MWETALPGLGFSQSYQDKKPTFCLPLLYSRNKALCNFFVNKKEKKNQNISLPQTFFLWTKIATHALDNSYYCLLDSPGSVPNRDKSLVTFIPSRMDRQCPRGVHNETRAAALGHDGSVATEIMKGKEPQLEKKERVTLQKSEVY